MDESLNIKKLERQIVEKMVAKELISFSQKVVSCIREPISFLNMDFDAQARKIIAIIKEHSA